MTVYQWLSVLGVPALFAIFYKLMYSQIKRANEQSSAVRAGIQALLRSRLYDEYDKATEKGYTTMQSRENFENCYVQYHALGENGVMDDIRKRFLKLPIAAEKGETND